MSPNTWQCVSQNEEKKLATSNISTLNTCWFEWEDNSFIIYSPLNQSNSITSKWMTDKNPFVTTSFKTKFFDRPHPSYIFTFIFVTPHETYLVSVVSVKNQLIINSKNQLISASLSYLFVRLIVRYWFWWPFQYLHLKCCFEIKLFLWIRNLIKILLH